MNEIKDVVEFTFYDFCKTVEQLVKDGFTFMDTNSGFPQATVGLYTCQMQKEGTPAEETATNATIPAVTKGRKPKQ